MGNLMPAHSAVFVFLLTAAATSHNGQWPAGEHHAIIAYVKGDGVAASKATLADALKRNGWTDWTIDKVSEAGKAAQSDAGVQTAERLGVELTVFSDPLKGF